MVKAETIGKILIIAVAIVFLFLFWIAYSGYGIHRHELQVYGGVIGTALTVVLLAGIAFITFPILGARKSR